jgi:hypothetical protein
MNLREFKLDPSHFFSTPGLTWMAALKETKAVLDYLTDIDMILMIERGIRGSISSVMKRYAKANNVIAPGYDPSKPSSYITYLDVNNLYGYTLKHALSCRDFRWEKESSFNSIIEKIMRGETNRGFFIEADLNYPDHLHDEHNDYPLAPEKYIVSSEELSLHQQHIIDEMCDKGRKRAKTTKLIPNLKDKERYVVHHKTLRFYLEKGMRVHRVHRVISFEEEAWLEPYIMHCTAKRQMARNNFEKDFWKLMVKSLYGKSIEDERKHTQVKIILRKKILKKYMKKPLFDQFFILDENKAILKLRKSEVLLDKPIYLGFSVLDLSKLHMYICITIFSRSIMGITWSLYTPIQIVSSIISQLLTSTWILRHSVTSWTFVTTPRHVHSIQMLTRKSSVI